MPNLPFTQPVRTSHNSYSGDARRAIVEQLDSGVRCLELDIHASGWSAHGDFRIGHAGPGEEVMNSGKNPTSLKLAAWLECIAKWSREHPQHTPIALVIDSLYPLRTDAEGDLTDLNDALERAFGSALYRAADSVAPPPPAFDGRIICVLSGNSANRTRYAGVEGFHPALGVNAHGQIVMVHSTIGGGIDLWTGSITASPPAVDWRRHAMIVMPDMRCDNAVVAINDDGWVVGAYATQDAGIIVGVGALQANGRVKWKETPMGWTGIPLAMDIKDKAVTLHVAGSSTKASRFRGELNTFQHRVTWDDPADSAPPPPENVVTWNGVTVTCLPPDANGLLTYTVNAGAPQLVRLEQVMFLERKNGETYPLLDDAQFVSVGLKDNVQAINRANAAATAAMQNGLIVRFYYFTRFSTQNGVVKVQFPASDAPFADWYQNFVP